MLTRSSIRLVHGALLSLGSALLLSLSAGALAQDAAPLTPHQRLDQIDKRTPVPMHPGMAFQHKVNMQDHLKAIQEIVMALSQNDYKTVEAGAQKISPSGTAAMCEGMGAGTPGFRALADAFHAEASKIEVAAQKRKKDEVLRATGAALQLCVSCHAAYRQQVIESPGMGHGHNIPASTGTHPAQPTTAEASSPPKAGKEAGAGCAMH